MASVKAKLKVAREALANKDYQAASKAVSQVLDYEPENYNALVFLGLALLELGQYEGSEQAYLKAVESNPEQLLAWQGLARYYERREDWDKYIDILKRMIDIYAKNSNAVKCAETLQKLLDIRRTRGTRRQIIEALSLLLPDSGLYTVLCTLPAPDLTNPASTPIFEIQNAIYNSLPLLEELAQILEVEEQEVQNKEVEKRRTRLGTSGLEQLRKEVGIEIWSTSRIPDLYNDIINHVNTGDELRRSTEVKLLRYKLRYLYALSSSGDSFSTKQAIAEEVDSLVQGAIVLRVPDESAWSYFLEGMDYERIDGYDQQTLKQYIRLFPSSMLTVILRGYFMYKRIPLGSEEDDEEGQLSSQENEEDPLDLINEAFTSTPDSIIAHRIVAEVNLCERDYSSAMKVAENGLSLLRRWESNIGRKLQGVKKAFNVVLLTALVHLFPPKNHARALGIIDEVLSDDPANLDALMGKGIIDEYAEKWTHAAANFLHVLNIASDDSEQGLRAKEEQAWCLAQIGKLQEAILALQYVMDKLNASDEKDEDKARCTWRLGKCHWDMNDDHREEAYRLFIAALKYSPTFAPAFTSLGVYYSEWATPPDPIRASKCFQKAFELDAREGKAAHRLAIGFSEEREWDLVEVVARRTIEGEGGMNAGTGTSEQTNVARYKPTNAWAWKAIGVVELTRGNCASAIEAFQIALRADSLDHLSWLRLGEAYSKAGRHAAAIRALHHAHDLNPDDWVSLFYTGEVQRQMGSFKDAIKTFENILSDQSSEGVKMALADSYLQLGLSERTAGFFARAESALVSSIILALDIIKSGTNFRSVYWKIIADALYYLSRQETFINGNTVLTALYEVNSSLLLNMSDRVKDVLPAKLLRDPSRIDGVDALTVAVAAYDHRISLIVSGSQATASLWYDLGMVLLVWCNSPAPSLPSGLKEKAKKRAVEYLTRAVKDDPDSPVYWDALGNAHFIDNPKLAQHAYIMTLGIDSKNVVTWTNLGLLYLYHEDVGLANQALYRSQILDPDHAPTWLGQGLVATKNGHDKDATALFEHATGLTAAASEADFKFAIGTFALVKEKNFPNRAVSMASLLPAFFPLRRYCEQYSDEPTAQHLLGLICERLGQIDLARDMMSRAISCLESVYEETEDPEVERQYTIANLNLARLSLRQGDLTSALEAFQSALGLLPEGEKIDHGNLVLRVQALFGIGLAYFRIGNLQEAVNALEQARLAANPNMRMRGHVTVLLAQVLWDVGTKEHLELAKALLLECISTDPENLLAINVLAGMGIVTEDDDLVDAALSEILSLPPDRRHALDLSRDVEYLLIQHHLSQGEPRQALSTAQKAVIAEPQRSAARHALGTLVIQQGLPSLALGALACGSIDPQETRENSDIPAIAAALGREGKEVALKTAQRAIFLQPWQARHWRILACVRATGKRT